MARRTLASALLSLLVISSCVSGDAPPDEELGDEGIDEAAPLSEDSPESDVTCPPPADTYSPYAVGGGSPMATVVEQPWHGLGTSYPEGSEDFRGYGPALPAAVECGGNKGQRSHLDVTAGCLAAASFEGSPRGRIESTSAGAFRALALGYVGANRAPIKWTDQSNQYRFFYAATSGPGVLPGFKAFVRYRSEDDLYVASWRTDGVVQIQKKQCGTYTALEVLPDFGAPSPNAWHTIRFDAIGDRLELYLDGVLVIAITDATFSWGTAGIRTDAMTGAYLDDWQVNPV